MVMVMIVMIVVVVRTGAERDAVLAVVVAERGTQADAVAEPRQAAAERVGFGRAGGQDTAQVGRFDQFVRLVRIVGGLLEKLRSEWRCEDEARHLDVVGLAPGAAHVERQVFGKRHVRRGAALAQVVSGVARCGAVDVHVLRHALRDAFVDHVDGAADGRAAIEQDRRTAQNFDALRS